MRLLVTMAALSLCGISHAAELPFPLTFHAAFDGSLDAEAAGSGAPLQVDGPVEFRAGKVGEALLVGDGGAAVWYASAGNARSRSGTIEMWVCPLDWTGEEDEFHVFFEALDPGWLVFYRYYQGGILTLTGPDNGHYTSAASPPIHWKPGEWHHLAGVWRGTALEVYIDGKLAGSSPNPNLPEVLASRFRLGDHPWHVARQRQSLLDEVKIYTAPLAPDCIARAAAGEPIGYRATPQLIAKADPERQILGVTCDAAGLVGNEGPARSARVELRPAGEAHAVALAVVQEFPGDVGACELPLAAVAPGAYRVHAALLNADGATVAEASTGFTMPGPPVWSGNELGRADRVLPPYTPVVTDAAASSCSVWGRRYTFAPLLSQVSSAGSDLLAGPVTLEAVVDGQTVPLSGAPCIVEGASDTRAVFTGQIGGAGLQGSLRHEVEFDGFTWTDISLSAPEPVRVQELRLTWSMPAGHATLYHADQMKWSGNPAGALPVEGWTSPFTHYFWLGNEERGLSWYAERDQDWEHSADRPAIEVTRAGEEMRATVRLLATETGVTSRHYGFGMMATPVRPQPEGVRGWRMTPARGANIDIIWPNDAFRWYGHPEPLDAERLAARVKAIQDTGGKSIPYINLNFASAGIPEWQFYGSRWGDPARVVTPSDVAAMGYASMGTCPAVRDWQDYILWRINEMIDRFGVDGIYIDCWCPYDCQAGPCGWKDSAGKIHPTRPIRAYREIIRRVCALFHEKRPDPTLMVHMSSEVVMPMLSFTDTLLDGEQWGGNALKDDYLPLMPPDRFRAEFMGRNHGPVDFFLPEFRDPNVTAGTRNLAPYLLLHDVNPWPIWSDAAIWNQVYDAVDAAGIVSARFLPYWQEPVATAPDGVLVSGYASEKGAVLAIMNTGEATEARLELDLQRLGLTAAAGARDPLEDIPLALEGNALSVPLARHQGRVIVLSH